MPMPMPMPIPADTLPWSFGTLLGDFLGFCGVNDFTVLVELQQGPELLCILLEKPLIRWSRRASFFGVFVLHLLKRKAVWVVLPTY